MAECSLWGVISSAATTRDITWSHVPVLEVATSCVLGSAACSARHFRSRSCVCLPTSFHVKHRGCAEGVTPRSGPYLPWSPSSGLEEVTQPLARRGCLHQVEIFMKYLDKRKQDPL